MTPRTEAYKLMSARLACDPIRHSVLDRNGVLGPMTNIMDRLVEGLLTPQEIHTACARVLVDYVDVPELYNDKMFCFMIWCIE
jgi:hypothetical protein